VADLAWDRLSPEMSKIRLLDSRHLMTSGRCRLVLPSDAPDRVYAGLWGGGGVLPMGECHAGRDGYSAGLVMQTGASHNLRDAPSSSLSPPPPPASRFLCIVLARFLDDYAGTYKCIVRLTTEWLVVGYRTLKDRCECMSRSRFIGSFAAEEGCGPVR